MGGPIVAEVASKQMLPNILGVAVIDVVEGKPQTAMTWMKSEH